MPSRPWLGSACIAIEDKRFEDHQGVDWVTTLKACVKMFLGRGEAGGSTITQQLVKNITGRDEVTVRRKLVEIFSALELEKKYTKKQIMELYLNVIALGENCAPPGRRCRSGRGVPPAPPRPCGPG